MALLSRISLIQVSEIMRMRRRSDCEESGLMMNVHQHHAAGKTSCHDDYLSGADARRRSEPMKQSAWDKSIFHLFRARALPYVCRRLCAVRPSVHPPDTAVSTRRARPWYRVISMTAASDVAAATNLQQPPSPPPSSWWFQQQPSGGGGKWPSQVPARIITSDANVRLEMASLITAASR